MQLRILTLGQFKIERVGQAQVILDTDKTRAVLAYLAYHAPRPQPREHLAGLLWSDQPQEKALHSLRQALSALRKGLEEGTDQPGLVVEQGLVGLSPAVSVWMDAAELALAVEQSLPVSSIAGRRDRLDIRRLQDALRLYQGRFLGTLRVSGSPLFEEWLVLQQEAIDQKVIAGLHRVIAYHERRGEYGLSVQAASRLVELAPWDDSAHMLLMRQLALSGQLGAAQGQYQRCRRYMMDEMGVEPLPETTELYETIRRCAVQQQPYEHKTRPLIYALPDVPLPLIGRQELLRQLSSACAAGGVRLVTLLGPGGIGKSRLALEAAREQVGLFPDGVFWVHLAGVGNTRQPPEMLLVEAVAAAIGFRFKASTVPVETQLLDYLRQKEMLLVLDNFEHLLPAAELVAQIPQQAPEVMLLVTSRSALNLHHEHVLEVGGLQEDAPVLFEQTARRASPNIDLACEADAVAEICRMVDGSPLALESAAALARSYSCRQIADGLARSLDFITSTRTDIPLRHRSLRAVFEQSWCLLTVENQALLAALSIFAGPFSLEAVRAVGCALVADGRFDLRQLTQHSLVRLAAEPVALNRFDLHPLVQRFAAEKLAESRPQLAAVMESHARFFAAQLSGDVRHMVGIWTPEALDALERDLPDIRQAWEWVVRQGDPPLIQPSTEVLYHFYRVRGLIQEGIQLFNRAVEVLLGRLDAQPDLEAVLGICLARLGALQSRMHLHEPARASLEQAARILAGVGAPPEELAFCALAQAGLARWRRDVGDPLALGHSALDLYRACVPVDNQHLLVRQAGEASAQEFIGIVLSNRGELDGARAALEKSLLLARQLGSPLRQVSPLNVLADLSIQQNDFGPAVRLYEEALDISRRYGDRFNTALLLNNLGTAYHLQDQIEEARQYYADSLEMTGSLGDLAGEVVALNNLAELALLESNWTVVVDLAQRVLELQDLLAEEDGRSVALINLAEACLALGRLPEAAKALQEAHSSEMPEDMFDQLGRQLVITAGLALRLGERALAPQLVLAAAGIAMSQEIYLQKGCGWLADNGLSLPDEPPLPPRQAAALAAAWLSSFPTSAGAAGRV